MLTGRGPMENALSLRKERNRDLLRPSDAEKERRGKEEKINKDWARKLTGAFEGWLRNLRFSAKTKM